MPEDLLAPKNSTLLVGGRTFKQRREDLFRRLQESVELCRLNYSGKRELATEQDETIAELCEALEESFNYGLCMQGSISLTAASIFQNMQEIVTGSSNGSNELTFWDFCQLHLTTHERERYEQLKHVWTKWGRGRAFIRASLNENCLQRYMLTWLDAEEDLRRYYTHWSLLLNAEMAKKLPQLLGSLDQVLFALNVDNTELNARTPMGATHASKPTTREEPIIYAPTPKPATAPMGAKRKTNPVERPIASSSSTEDLLSELQQTTSAAAKLQAHDLVVTANVEEPTPPGEFEITPPDPIEPELEFLKTPLSDCYVESQNDVVEYVSDDTSSQYSKSSSALCGSASNSAQQLAESEERLRDMSERCALLETRVAQLSLENRQLLRRLKQVFEDTGIDPSSSMAGCNFLITIPQVELVKSRRRTGTSSSHYVYEIHITMRQRLEYWSLRRRYRDFHKLHQTLLRTHPHVAAVDFPPKKHFGNMNRVFVEERRQQLQIYLLNLVEALPQVEACKSKAELQKSFPFFRER